MNISWPNWPIWNPSAYDYLKQVVDSGRWTIRGAWTGAPCLEEQFQRRFANYIGTKYAVLTTSGTMALQLAMEVLEIGDEDEVIVPALTWFAPVAAVLNVGAVPKLTDVDARTTCLHPEAVRKNITARTKAILVVHLHCQVADMDEILRIASEYGLYVIEDCSQAHGAAWKNRKVGSIGDIAAFSFNQEKALPCGEGGAVTTNRADLYSRLNRVRLDGCDFDADRKILAEDQLIYDDRYMGRNASISEFQTAVLLSQLELLDERNLIKNQNAALLNALLEGHPLIEVMELPPQITTPSYYEYTFYLKLAPQKINQVLEALTMQTGVVFHPTDIPVYRNPLFNPISRKKYQYYTSSEEYRNLSEREFPGCEAAYQQIVAFAHSVLLAKQEEIRQLGLTIREVLDHYV